MSDISIKIDAQEFVDSLDQDEKKFLVHILREDLEDEFDKPIDPEWQKQNSGEVEGTIYVDIDDVVSEMSYCDRSNMYDELKEEYGDDDCDCEECEECECLEEQLFSEASTYQDQELAAAFLELWRSRHLLTKSQVERIQAITREPYV